MYALPLLRFKKRVIPKTKHLPDEICVQPALLDADSVGTPEQLLFLPVTFLCFSRSFHPYLPFPKTPERAQVASKAYYQNQWVRDDVLGYEMDPQVRKLVLVPCPGISIHVMSGLHQSHLTSFISGVLRGNTRHWVGALGANSRTLFPISSNQPLALHLNNASPLWS